MIGSTSCLKSLDLSDLSEINAKEEIKRCQRVAPVYRVHFFYFDLRVRGSVDKSKCSALCCAVVVGVVMVVPVSVDKANPMHYWPHYSIRVLFLLGELGKHRESSLSLRSIARELDSFPRSARESFRYDHSRKSGS